ncbi:uncharacterized protein TNCV_2081211 [Trichonephila clavipes]|nr:uncharacterized protein TNCV_2081211 [Trichonephila clavipes]
MPAGQVPPRASSVVAVVRNGNSYSFSRRLRGSVGGTALTFLQLYHDDGDEFLDRIVTGDETWISHFTPETKQQSMHWRYSGSPVRTKLKQMLSVRKVGRTVFWDRKGILLIFFPRGETVNVNRYCETLWKFRRAVQNKRRGMLNAGVLLRDNARPHTARRTAAVLTEFG